MTIAQGVFKKVAIKKETVWGTAAGAAGSRYLRRVSSDVSLTKDSYASKEIRDDQQVAVNRHGMRKVEGTISTELSPGSYSDLIAAVLRKDFASGTAVPAGGAAFAVDGLDLSSFGGTVASLGFKVGQVVRVSGFTNNAPARNLIITALQETPTKLLKLEALDGSALVAESGASPEITLAGKGTLVPTTGHTDDSFTLEHFFSDIAQSEVFTGVKIDSVDIKLPPTGMAEMSIKVMGKDMTSGTAAYFTSPAAAGTTNTLAAVNGRVYAIGSRLTLLTGLDLSIKGGLSTEPVVGSNTAPFLFRGRVEVTGNATAFFENGQLRDAFLNETEVALVAVFTAGNGAADDFIAFRLPRVKFSAATKDDGEKGLVQTMPFVALLAAGDTTIAIQDSAAP